MKPDHRGQASRLFLLERFTLGLVRISGVRGAVPVDLDHGRGALHILVVLTFGYVALDIRHLLTSLEVYCYFTQEDLVYAFCGCGGGECLRHQGCCGKIMLAKKDGGINLQVSEFVPALVGWLKRQLEASGLKGFVVGLSGGIDSAVVAVLCKKACPENTLGVIMPCYSNEKDTRDAESVARLFGIAHTTVVLDQVWRSFAELLTGRSFAELDLRELALANLKPRLRMATLYFYANQRRALVVGTGNRSELAIGYFTKYGDGGADLLPIGNLLKRQVREVAAYLGIPEAIINRPPSAGLWEGQNDERELGFSYEELDHYLCTGEAAPHVKAKIEALARQNEHKLRLPPIPDFHLSCR